MNLTERQREIIDCAVRIIARRGIQQLTMKSIAREIGISEPGVYRHFESKSAVILMILEQFRSITGAHLDALVGDDSSWDGVTAFIRERVNRCIANPDLAKVMFSEENFRILRRRSEGVPRNDQGQ